MEQDGCCEHTGSFEYHILLCGHQTSKDVIHGESNTFKRKHHKNCWHQIRNSEDQPDQCTFRGRFGSCIGRERSISFPNLIQDFYMLMDSTDPKPACSPLLLLGVDDVTDIIHPSAPWSSEDRGRIRHAQTCPLRITCTPVSDASDSRCHRQTPESSLAETGLDQRLLHASTPVTRQRAIQIQMRYTSIGSLDTSQGSGAGNLIVDQSDKQLRVCSSSRNPGECPQQLPRAAIALEPGDRCLDEFLRLMSSN